MPTENQWAFGHVANLELTIKRGHRDPTDNNPALV